MLKEQSLQGSDEERFKVKFDGEIIRLKSFIFKCVFLLFEIAILVSSIQ